MCRLVRSSLFFNASEGKSERESTRGWGRGGEPTEARSPSPTQSSFSFCESRHAFTGGIKIQEKRRAVISLGILLSWMFQTFHRKQTKIPSSKLREVLLVIINTPACVRLIRLFFNADTVLYKVAGIKVVSERLVSY